MPHPDTLYSQHGRASSALIGQINQMMKFPYDQSEEQSGMCNVYILYFGGGKYM